VVLSTARHVRPLDGLRVALVDGRLLRVAVGARTLATVAWPPPAGPCPGRLLIRHGVLEVGSRTVRVGSGYPGGMPSVSGLFSELDLRKLRGFRVEVRTGTYATTPSARQLAAVILAVLLLLAALTLVVRGHGIDRRRLRRPSIARVDGVVVVVLLAWLVLSPVFVDDGWVVARQRAYADTDAFSNLYDSYGANLPLIYWLEWLQHWLTGSTAQLLLLRIPSLLAILAGWALARWCLGRAWGGAPPRAATWTLAAGYLLLAMAWCMTLRPEPIVGLLTVAALAAALSFVRRPGALPLVAGIVLAALAPSAHPAGVAALAPLLAISRHVIRWARATGNTATAVAIALGGVSLVILLVFLDTDLETWQRQRRLLEHSEFYRAPWWSEWDRYTVLIQNGWGTPIRIMSTILPLLVVLSFALRRGASLPKHLALPAQSLAVALVLLVLTPDKSPYHLGAIAGIVAVAAAVESGRFAARQAAAGRSTVGPVLAVLVLFLAVLYSWSQTFTWGSLDLQTTSWSRAFELLAPVPVVALAMLAAAALLSIRRNRRGRGAGAGGTLWLVAAWMLPVGVASLVAATAGILIRDAAAADGWSPARQYLGALAGRGDCGLAESLTIAADAPPGTKARLRRPGITALLDPSLAAFFPCAEPAGLEAGTVEIPDVVVAWDVPWLATRGTSAYAGIGDVFRLRLVATHRRRVRIYTVERAIAGAVAVGPVRAGR
jgi:arabinosyltransferase C